MVRVLSATGRTIKSLEVWERCGNLNKNAKDEGETILSV